MIRYDVAAHHDLTKLVEIVNAQIKKGYKPLGGLCVSVSQTTNNSSKDVRYTQALIKEADTQIIPINKEV